MHHFLLSIFNLRCNTCCEWGEKWNSKQAAADYAIVIAPVYVSGMNFTPAWLLPPSWDLNDKCIRFTEINWLMSHTLYSELWQLNHFQIPSQMLLATQICKAYVSKVSAFFAVRRGSSLNIINLKDHYI